MAKEKTTNIVGKIIELLTPLSSEERQRIVQASLVLLGETLMSPVNSKTDVRLTEEEIGDWPMRTQKWLKQSNLSMEKLQQVFLITEGNAEVIASEIPGKGKKKQTFNTYILTGIASLISTGNPSFDDKSARALCKSFGCFDVSNHALYLRERGNEFSGSKDRGWTLTTPGLNKGALLIKELNK